MQKIKTQMRYTEFIMATLLSLLLCINTNAQEDEKIRIAMAMSVAAQNDEERVQRDDLCPCSVNGTCNCGSNDECGCLAKNQYRWIATKDPNQTALYRGNVQLGNYRHNEGKYTKLIEYNDGSYTWEYADCPVKGEPVRAIQAPINTATGTTNPSSSNFVTTPTQGYINSNSGYYTYPNYPTYPNYSNTYNGYGYSSQKGIRGGGFFRSSGSSRSCSG